MSSSPFPPNNPYHAQYDPAGGPTPPGKKSSLGLVLVILGVISVVGLLICCGGGYFLYSVGSNVAGAQMKFVIQDNPEVKEKLGEIQNCSIDLAAVAAHPENQKNDSNSAVMVFNVVGSKGTGTLVADIRDDSDEQIYKPRELRLSTGEIIRFE